MENGGNIIRLRKDVIKNIAIIFLSVLLVLTFFSNSIMNKSLPEVAVTYIEGKTITEKIRGTGVVEADDPYKLIVPGGRVISSVAVKEGDDVTKGQILFYLEDGDSTDLDKAEKDLEDLIYKYTVEALKGEMSAQAYNQATTGNVSSMAVYEAQIEAAKAKVKAAQDKVDSVTRQQSIMKNSSSEDTETELAKAQNELESEKTRLTDAKTYYENMKKAVSTGEGSALATETARLEEANASAKYETEYNKAIVFMNDVTKWDDIILYMNSASGGLYSGVTDVNQLKAVIFDNVDSAGELHSIKDADALNYWVKAEVEVSAGYTAEMLEDLTKAYKECMDKKSLLKEAESAEEVYRDALSKLASAESDYNSINNKVNELQTKVEKLTNEKAENTAGNKQLEGSLQIAKEDADRELEKAKAEEKQLLQDISSTLNLDNQSSAIREQREKVEKLREKAIGATITSPVDGKILSVSKASGETTADADPIVTIQVAGKPMTMSFSVTNEQAARVQTGDIAEIQNSWYYNDLTARLTQIKVDKENPGKKKKLVFTIEGDVASGTSLSLSVGQKSGEYDKTVPNSAIKEDNRGKFILVIEEKSSPFGTRYKAKRVDVSVLASDDNISAIEADVDSWTYAITTSDKPVASGTQVRLSDN